MIKTEVVTLGLGYIGLPTSALLAKNGTKVLGVDIDKNIVDIINKGKIHIVEPSLDEIVFNAVSKGNLRASLKPTIADVFLIVVPTPFKQNHEPDIRFIETATESVIPFLKEGDLFIIESTSPVGTTEKIKNLIFKHKPQLEDKIYIAYCPERVLPGNIMHELVNNDRVIGGINEISTQKAVEFYSKYVLGNLHPTNARTAEMCKLVENSSRDIQIAFANELSMICEKANINVWELIGLANKHPRVNILQPGSGVGGHCIAVDPYFIVSDYPSESKIIRTSREVNNFKPVWCIEKIELEKNRFESKYGRVPKIALMGLAFKPDIDDLRESPAEFIVKKLFKKFNKEDLYIVEPNIKSHSIFEIKKYEEAIESSDIIVFLVAHKEFKKPKLNKSQFLIDFCGITNK